MWNATELQFLNAARYRKYMIKGFALLLFVMLAVLMPGLKAHAALSSCDGDPIVTLSNGVIIQMKVHLDIPASQVSKVLYTLHAPTGTSVLSVVFTGGPLAGKEAFAFSADEMTNRYDGVTFADTQMSAVVTAQMRAILGSAGITSVVATGPNNQDIYTSVSLENPASSSSTSQAAHMTASTTRLR